MFSVKFKGIYLIKCKFFKQFDWDVMSLTYFQWLKTKPCWFWLNKINLIWKELRQSTLTQLFSQVNPYFLFQVFLSEKSNCLFLHSIFLVVKKLIIKLNVWEDFRGETPGCIWTHHRKQQPQALQGQLVCRVAFLQLRLCKSLRWRINRRSRNKPERSGSAAQDVSHSPKLIPTHL